VAAVAVAAVLAVVWAVWLPPVRDLAGQLHRVEQYEALGPQLWDNLWYGGHYTPSYSALFPPLAALLGIPLTGVLAATAAAGCFAALLRAHVGSAVWAGALWFAAATATNLFTGRIPFALGIALALAACLAAQRGRPVAAALLGVATAATSGVAAALVGLVGVALIVAAPSPRARRDGIVLALAPGLTVVAIGLAFPVGGDARFGPITLIASVAAGAAVWAAARPADRVLRAGALVYVVACLLAFIVPSPLGGTAARLGALFAGPLFVTLLIVRHRTGMLPSWLGRPLGRVAIALLVAVALAWQWGPARLDVHDAVAPPSARSTQQAFYAPVLAQMERRSRGPVRAEIPFTATHYEALWIAQRVTIARGWLRQVDRAHNPLFYDGRLTADRYGRWLRDNGITWVAVPAVPLDHSARQERRVVDSHPPYLQEVWRSSDWTLFRVSGSPGLVSGPARLVRLDGDGFSLDVDGPGRVVVRVRHNRYWRVEAGRACVARTPSGWTAVHAGSAQRVEIAARVGSPMRLGGQPQCSIADDPARTRSGGR
jgi:hypothetical protein